MLEDRAPSSLIETVLILLLLTSVVLIVPVNIGTIGADTFKFAFNDLLETAQVPESFDWTAPFRFKSPFIFPLS